MSDDDLNTPVWMDEDNWSNPYPVCLSILDQALVNSLCRIIRAQEGAMPIDHSLEAGGNLNERELELYAAITARPHKR